MNLTIENGQNAITIDTTQESYHFCDLSGEDTLRLWWQSSTFQDIAQGAKVVFEGETYCLREAPSVEKINSQRWDYSASFYSPRESLKDIILKDLTTGEVKFSIVAKPFEILQLLTDNLKEATSLDWRGQCSAEAEQKLFSFDATSIYNALDMIEREFGTESLVQGRTIHLGRVEKNKDNPLVLKYGRGNGLLSGVEAKAEETPITRLYVQGGERNIDPFKYGSRTLRLPKDEIVQYKGIEYKTDPKGLFIERVQKANYTKEGATVLDGIYPKRVGVITQTIEKNGLYDFIDSSIPDDLDYGACTTAGQSLSVVFSSGMLQGREFSVNYHHRDKRFELIEKQEDGQSMPNDVFCPAAGDLYAVYGMSMPVQYIEDRESKTGASYDLLTEAVALLWEREQHGFTYSFKIDPIFIKANYTNIADKISLGAFVRIQDKELCPQGSDIRIVSIKRYLERLDSPEIDLSNAVVRKSGLSSLFSQITKAEGAIRQEIRQVKDSTKRTYQGVEATKAMIEGAFDNYSKTITPVSVDTMHLLVGDKSLQYEFIDSPQSQRAITFNIGYNQKRQIEVSEAWLKHYTLEIEAVKPQQKCRIWHLQAFVSGELQVEQNYFLYARVEKGSDNGFFSISQDKLPQQEESLYNLLVSVVAWSGGEHQISKMYGYSQVLPGQITTSTLSSSDGSAIIELKDQEITLKGNVKFEAGSSALTQINNAVKDIKVGGRNLLRDSKRLIKNSDYNIAIYPLTETLKEGDIVTCTIKGKLAETKTSFWVYNSGDRIDLAFLEDIGNGFYRGTFKWAIAKYGVIADNKSFWVWSFKGDQPGESIIEWIKLERGNVATDWTPAPEDSQTDIKDLGERLQSVDTFTKELQRQGFHLYTLDLTAFDPNLYYPCVTSPLSVVERTKIRVENSLWQDNGLPSWKTHDGGFSLSVEWEVTGSGWGIIDTNRQITRFNYAWAPVSPILNIGQWENLSKEYFFLRGGAKYRVYITGGASVAAYKDGFVETAGYTFELYPMSYDKSKEPEDRESRALRLEREALVSKQMLDKMSFLPEMFAATNIRGNAVMTGALLTGGGRGASAGVYGGDKPKSAQIPEIEQKVQERTDQEGTYRPFILTPRFSSGYDNDEAAFFKEFSQWDYNTWLQYRARKNAQSVEAFVGGRGQGDMQRAYEDEIAWAKVAMMFFANFSVDEQGSVYVRNIKARELDAYNLKLENDISIPFEGGGYFSVSKARLDYRAIQSGTGFIFKVEVEKDSKGALSPTIYLSNNENSRTVSINPGEITIGQGSASFPIRLFEVKTAIDVLKSIGVLSSSGLPDDAKIQKLKRMLEGTLLGG